MHMIKLYSFYVNVIHLCALVPIMLQLFGNASIPLCCMCLVLTLQ